MLKIKLARIGKKKAPIYRFIISEVGRDPHGRVLENLGSYNPKSKELQAKAERINYWLGQGAQMTTTVNNLLVKHQIVKGEIIRVVSKQPAPATETTKDKDKSKATPPATESADDKEKVPEPTAESVSEESAPVTETAEVDKETTTDETPSA